MPIFSDLNHFNPNTGIDYGNTTRVTNRGSVRGEVTVADGIQTDNQFRSVTEFDEDLDFVILQSNEREGETGVTAEPKHQGDVVNTRSVGIVFETDV